MPTITFETPAFIHYKITATVKAANHTRIVIKHFPPPGFPSIDDDGLTISGAAHTRHVDVAAGGGHALPLRHEVIVYTERLDVPGEKDLREYDGAIKELHRTGNSAVFGIDDWVPWKKGAPPGPWEAVVLEIEGGIFPQ